jgi:hypothetical protein
MQITAIHAHHVRIPYDMGAPTQAFAGLRFPSQDHLLVQVDTDAGITGWGEGFGHNIIPATKAALHALSWHGLGPLVSLPVSRFLLWVPFLCSGPFPTRHFTSYKQPTFDALPISPIASVTNCIQLHPCPRK